MFPYARAAVGALTAVAWMSMAARAQPESADLAGFVTMVGGAGESTRIEAEAMSAIPELFSYVQNRIEPGEGVRTGEGSTAVVFLPAYDAVVHLGGESELHLVEPSTLDSGVGIFVVLASGRASVVRKPGSMHWLLLAVEAEATGAAGYTLSKGTSLFVEVREDNVTFASRNGDALYFSGRIPAGVLIGATGEPIDKSGVLLPQGRRIVTQAPIRPVPDEEADIVVPVQLRDDMETFALTQSEQWLYEAEKGDFTPVRGAARAAPEMLGAEFEPSLVFDQAKPVLAAPAPRLVTSAVRTSLSPAQTLIESGVPGTVIAGQRFRRSRIIGNPGTAGAGTGALTVNRAAELLVRLNRD